MLMNRRNILLSIPLIAGTGMALSSCGVFDEKESPPTSPDEDTADIVKPSVQVREIDGVQYDMTEQFLSIGSFTAENKLRIYEDLQCPYCKDLKKEIIEDVKQLVNDEKLIVEFVVVNYLGVRSTNAWSEQTANLLAVVANSQPDKFIDVQKVLYDNQPDKRNTDPFTGEQLRKMVSEVIELSEEEIQQIDDGTYISWVNEIVNPFAAENEISSIPTVVWNETVLEDYNSIVDELAKL